MIKRIFNIPNKLSFFLLGGRATGKSTLIKHMFRDVDAKWYDLLDPNLEARLTDDPMLLERECLALKKKPDWIVIDEVQKVPSLLDVVHRVIENQGIRFALTGSSARKLKRGSANLLAGRALQKFLFPITHQELGKDFDLDFTLRWGSLPQIYDLDDAERTEYLTSYANTYIREEIQIEQIVRKLPPFRRFLQVAAQCSGQVINYSNIAKDIGSDPVSVQSYFGILEDTLVGITLDSFHESIRKRQRKNPKFYFFDIGVCRALSGLLEVPVNPRTTDYGNAFEHFIFLEILRLSAYRGKNWRFSYLRTKDDAEIDLIIERPGQKRALIEIKSKEKIDSSDLRHLIGLGKDIENSEFFCFSRDNSEQIIEKVKCFPWAQGIKAIGL